jgi:hypothetical protein
MELEGMSYEDAQSDGYGGGLCRRPFIGTAFDTGSSAGAPDGSEAGEFGCSGYAGFAVDASFTGYASDPFGASVARYTGAARGTCDSG